MEKALVLGGGGITGMAWEAGILAGLNENDVQFNHADVVLGTSAGSFIGSLLVNGYDMKSYYQYLAQHKDKNDQAKLSKDLYRRWVSAVIDGGEDEVKVAKLFGEIAKDVKPVITSSERQKAVKVRLKDSQWQSQLKIAALDIETGQLKLFSQQDGISLMEAVTASGAVPGLWPTVEFKGHLYMDGGFVNSANAMAVKEAKHIVVIAPLTQKQGKLQSVREDVEDLEKTQQVTLITPNEKCKEVIGNNIYDATNLEEIGRKGYEQGLKIAKHIDKVWKAKS